VGQASLSENVTSVTLCPRTKEEDGTFLPLGFELILSSDSLWFTLTPTFYTNCWDFRSLVLASTLEAPQYKITAFYAQA
jgi:hypothetical protein